MAKRTCPHCGGENPVSTLVTLCRHCGRGLDRASLPPPVPRGVRLPDPEPPPPPPPPLPIVRLPWDTPSLPGDVGTPEEVGPTPEPPAIGPGSAYADWPLRLPIALHLVLYAVGTMAGFLGGPYLVLPATRHLSALAEWSRPVAFLGSALGGLIAAKLLFRYVILGRCPKCKAGAMFRGGRPITYHCQACGYVHRSSVSGG
ncbi:MAG: hypothetical protein FJX74_23770 [Armatimonadetes bacterium]|nr:hypothetical protein [Armatimonadota bacterium]